MSVGTGMRQPSCRSNALLLVFKMKWKGGPAAMGSGQVMKPRRPVQDFARDFGGLNVEARVFRNSDKGHAFRPHDHLTALDGGKFILGNDKQRINFDEVFLL